MGAVSGAKCCCGSIKADVSGEIDPSPGGTTVDDRNEKITIVETDPIVDKAGDSKQDGGGFSTIATPVETRVLAVAGAEEPIKPAEAPSQGGSTASIAEAIQRGKRSSVLRHVEEGADLEAVDDQGQSILHLASIQKGGRDDIAQDLIGLGANINAQDKVGKTPMHYAAIYGNATQVSMMLERRADVDCQDNADHTPLHYAAEQSHMDVAKVLLMANCDVNRKNDIGYTPYGMAEDMGTLPMQELLKIHGAVRGDGSSARKGVRPDRG